MASMLENSSQKTMGKFYFYKKYHNSLGLIKIKELFNFKYPQYIYFYSIRSRVKWKTNSQEWADRRPANIALFLLQSIDFITIGSTISCKSNSSRCCFDGIVANATSSSACIEYWIKYEPTCKLFSNMANDTAALIAADDVAYVTDNESQIRQSSSEKQQ